MAFAWTVSRGGGRSAGTAVIRGLSCAMARAMSSEHSHGCGVLGRMQGDEPGATVAAPEGQGLQPEDRQAREGGERKPGEPRLLGKQEQAGGAGAKHRSGALAGGLPPPLEKRGERGAVPAGARPSGIRVPSSRRSSSTSRPFSPPGRRRGRALHPGYRRDRRASLRPARRRVRVEAREARRQPSPCSPTTETDSALRALRGACGQIGSALRPAGGGDAENGLAIPSLPRSSLPASAYRSQVSSCRLSHAASRDPGASGVSVGRCCNDAVGILPGGCSRRV